MDTDGLLEDAALVDALYRDAPVGLCIWGLDLRCRRVNPALVAFNGVPAEQQIGRTIHETFPDIADRIAANLQLVLRTGSVVHATYEGELPGRPGEQRTWRVTYHPISGRDGAIAGVGSIIEETTELDRTREELDRERSLLLDVLERAPAAMALLWGLDHRLRLANARMRGLLGVDADDGVTGLPLARILAPGAAIVAVPVLDETLASGRPRRVEDVAVPPVREDGEVRWFEGTLSPVPGPDGRPAGVLVTAQETTAQVRRRRSLVDELHSEREITDVLQRALLPQTLPELPGMRLAVRYEAAGERFAVGGDFYDVMANVAGGWTVVVGDVCGKGPEAAAMTAMARYTLRAEAAHVAAPGRLLSLLSEELLRQQPEPDAALPLRFVTAVVASLHPEPGGVAVRMAHAGHPPAILVRAAGGVELLRGTAPPAGVLPGTAFDETSCTLAPGDALVLYTDGVLDAHAPAHTIGPGDLAARLDGGSEVGAEALAERVVDLVHERPGEPRDDYAVLVLQAL